MKLFKNFVTKKKLKEENERLKRMITISTRICDVEKNEKEVKKVSSSFTVPNGENIPEEVVKHQIAKNMIQFLQPLIFYDFSDNIYGGKTYYGSLYVANENNKPNNFHEKR